MTPRNPKRIHLAADYDPRAARNATAAEGLQALYETTAEINNAMATVSDPRALSKAVAQRSAAALAKAKKRLEQAQMQSAKHAEEIGAVLKKRNVEFEREIRDHVRGSKSPAETIRRMISAGEDVGPIFRAPSYLSGLDDQQYGVLYQFAKATFTPELHQKEKDADHGIDLLSRAIDRFSTEANRLGKLITTSDEAIAQALVAPKEPVA